MFTSVCSSGIVLQKLSMNELITIEKRYSLWEHKLFNYPLWIHCREPLLKTGIMVERRIVRPTLVNMLKSFFLTIKFLFTQKKYDKVFFLMERAELLEIYKEDKNSRKILFLNAEQDRVCESDYISSDFLNLLRFLSRKIVFMIFYKKYKKIIKHLEILNCDEFLKKYIKIAMGDAFFLKFLSLILIKQNKKIYTGSVIPMGEKFLNTLNSYEVQHGVIHLGHMSYIAIPPVKNTLILYHEHYRFFLLDNGYIGRLYVKEYKKTFFEKLTERYFPIVIYTQPLLKMQEDICQFMHKCQPKNVFIQKHPKDYFDYELNDSYFVSSTTPLEVGYPIVYSSSIIENFTLYDRDCYIYDVRPKTIDIEAFIKIYTLNSKSKMIIKTCLYEIYEMIEVK